MCLFGTHTDARAQLGGSGNPHADVWKYCLWGLIPWCGIFIMELAFCNEMHMNLSVKREFCKSNGGGGPAAQQMER